MHFAKELYRKKEEKQEEKDKKIKKQLFQPSKQEICHDDLEGSLSKKGEKHSSFEDFSELESEKTNITIEYIIEDEGSQLTLLKIIEKNQRVKYKKYILKFYKY